MLERPPPTLRANTRADASPGDVPQASEHGRASARVIGALPSL